MTSAQQSRRLLFATIVTVSSVSPYRSSAENIEFGTLVSVQVNVDANGQNISGDEGNTPSIAIDPNNPDRVVIGWRDIYGGDVPGSCGGPCLRRNAFAYSLDGGESWMYGGVIEPDEDRTLPSLAADGIGNFYYLSKRTGESSLLASNSIFMSSDGGASWNFQGIAPANEENQESWLVATKNSSEPTLYVSVNNGLLQSNNQGESFQFFGVGIPAYFSTIDVDPTGFVWAAGRTGDVFRFRDGIMTPLHDVQACHGIKAEGSVGRLWIVADPMEENRAYALLPTEGQSSTQGSVRDIEFVMTEDGGESWSEPVRVNYDGNAICEVPDPATQCRRTAYGMMSISPDGRIDAVWRNFGGSGTTFATELRYSYSLNRGRNWTVSIPIAPTFTNKGFSCASICECPGDICIGPHYYDQMVSTSDAVHIAYAAPVNPSATSPILNEWDIFYLRIDAPIPDWDEDGIIDRLDDDDDGDGTSDDEDVCSFTALGTPTNSNGRPLGDHTENCCADLTDFLHFPACLNLGGPNDVTIPALCRDHYNLDSDLNQDLFDFNLFQRAFEPTTCRPHSTCD